MVHGLFVDLGEEGELSRRRGCPFPNGQYYHSIHLKILEPGKDEREFRFTGAVSIEPDAIHVVGLSPFGTTIFRIDEDRGSGAISAQVYLDAMKKHEQQLRDFYSVIRLLLLTKKTAGSDLKRDSLGRPLDANISGPGVESGLHFLFNHYDEHGVPDRVQILAPRFQVDLTVTGYDL